MAWLAEKATTRMSAHGNDAEAGVTRRALARRARGFTLIELMVVIAIIAIAAGLAALSLRDPTETRLQREAARLAALLEVARTQSRTLGVSVVWMPVDGNAVPRPGDRDAALPAQFRFRGLPDDEELPTRWLNPGIQVEMPENRQIVLGPEPLIGAQRIVLQLEKQRLALDTDGLRPFTVHTLNAAGN